MQHGKNPSSPVTLTPAQQRLLNYCSHIEADSLFKYLMTSLGTSISGFAARDGNYPSIETLDSWYFTLDLLGLLHDLSVEGVEGDESPSK